MLRAGMLMFGAAWFAFSLLPGAEWHATWDAAVFFAVPAGIVNLVALVLLALSHAWVWGPRSDDEGNHKKAHRALARGSWMLVASLVLYAVALVAYEAALRT